jgi:anti-anti-sigma factor
MDPAAASEVEGVLIYRIGCERLFADKDIFTVREDLTELVRARPAIKLAIDLTRVEVISSRAIGVLVGIRKNVKDGGGRIALFGMSPTVEKLMQVMHMESLFIIKPDQPNAVHALRHRGLLALLKGE